METINHLFPPHLVQAVGWTILHSLWQGALIGLLLGIAMVCMHKHSAGIRYFIACTALGSMVVMAVITFINHYHAPLAVTPLAYTGNVHPLADIPLAVSAMENQPGFSMSLESFYHYFNQHLPLIVSSWALGVLLLMLRFLGGLAYVQRVKHYKTRPLPDYWQGKVLVLKERLQIERAVAVLESAVVKVPMVIGHTKPVILVPIAAMVGLAPKQLEAILAHELAHIARHDYLMNLVQTVADIVFFYHPVVWWVSAFIRTERENCCDDLALTIQQDSMALAGALADMEANRIRQQGWFTPALAMPFAKARKSALLHRVQRLFENRRRNPNFREGFIAAFVLMASLLSMSFMAGQTQPQESEVCVEKKPGLAWALVAPDSAPNVAGYLPATFPQPNPSQWEEPTENGMYSISKQLDDGRYLFARVTADGEIKALYVEGKKVPQKSYPLYQPVVDKELARIQKKEAGNVVVRGIAAPNVFSWKFDSLPPMPVMPPMPAMPIMPMVPMEWVSDSATLFKFKNLEDQVEGKEFKAWENSMKAWEKSMEAWGREAEKLEGKIDNEAMKEWKEAMKAWEKEMQAWGREIGQNKAFKQSWHFSTDDSVSVARRRGARPEDLERIREDVRTARARDVKGNVTVRSNEKTILQIDMGNGPGQSYSFSVNSKQLEKPLVEALLKDGFIQQPTDPFVFHLSANALWINQERQPENLFIAYKALVESSTSNRIPNNERFKLIFQQL